MSRDLVRYETAYHDRHPEFGLGVVTDVRRGTLGGSRIDTEVRSGRQHLVTVPLRDEACVLFPTGGVHSWFDSNDILRTGEK